MKEEQISLLWKGPLFKKHNLARINLNICTHLLKHNDINLLINSPEIVPHDSKYQDIASSINKSENANMETDITVSHQWTSEWNIPSSPYWVYMQPWEYSSIPKQWYLSLKDYVNEIWVYSDYHKEYYVQCGIQRSKIKVIPLGVDETIYHYNVKPLELKNKASFLFLFVGGSLEQESKDILLQAYYQEFSKDEDVCLIIKDTDTDALYKQKTKDIPHNNTLSKPDNPLVVYLNQQLSEQDIAGLYKTCHCLVQPQPDEGFVLPLIEAMACGTPAIIPSIGPSQDYCDADTAFLLPCLKENLKQVQIENQETISNPWKFNVDPIELQKMLRFVYEHRLEVKKRGQKASEKILSSYTWKSTVYELIHSVKQLVREKQGSPLNEKEDEDFYKQLLYGMQLYKNNQFQEAIKLFLTILSKHPDSVETRYNTAIVYMKMDEYDAAIQHLLHITNNMESESKDFQANIWSILAICYSQNGFFPNSIHAFQQAVKMNPSLRSQEIIYLKKCLQQTTDSKAELYQELGNCYFELGNDFDAEEAYMKALENGGDQNTLIDSICQVYQRINVRKKLIIPVHSKPSILPQNLSDSSITWVPSVDFPIEDSEEIIHERRKRWDSYFVSGNHVLEIQWDYKSKPDTNKTLKIYDGLILLVENKVHTALDVVHMLKYCFNRIKPTGKIIIIKENPSHTHDPLSSKNIVEMLLKSAGWSIKETNLLENKDSLYIVSQRTSYEILWQSPIFSSSGYAEEQNHFLDSLRPYPLKIKINPVDRIPPLEQNLSNQTKYLFSLLHQQIQSPLIHYQATPVTYFSHPMAPISIGRTMFETNSIPISWVEKLNEITEVWVPSEFNRETFASAGVKLEKIKVIPGTLDENKYNPLNVLPYPLKITASFKFLSVFDWSIRKGWEILLRAFLEEFKEDEDVSLILKVTKFNEPFTNPHLKIQELTKKLGVRKLPHIQIIEENLSQEEMIRLYAAVDCFVLPSRGEGWGRPYMEAMAMELPTIGTKWSGQQAFMTDENSYLINIEGLIPVDLTGMPDHFQGQKWAEPSVDHLKILMRHVYNHPEEAKQKGKNARNYLFPKFSKQRIGQQIFERMDELVQFYFS